MTSTRRCSNSPRLLFSARGRAFWLLGGLLLAGTGTLCGAGTNGLDELLNQAQAADLQGDSTNALVFANQAIAAAPTNAQCFYVRGRIYANHGEHTNALADFDRVLQREPRAGQVYQYRGFEYFRLARFTEAIADFDRFLEFLPSRAPFLWQRGVACYYAGRYEEARKQFELHRMVNANDAQNAAWHFASVARLEGVAKARAALFPNVDDQRVPMMHIYALLQGKLKSDEVLLAAKARSPSPVELKSRLFHAHFYIGLYDEAVGEEALARTHIITAADDYAIAGYLGDVARVHAGLLRQRSSPAK